MLPLAQKFAEDELKKLRYVIQLSVDVVLNRSAEASQALDDVVEKNNPLSFVASQALDDVVEKK